MDISENGRQIAEKLLILLNGRQRKELAEYVSHSLEQPVSSVKSPCATVDPMSTGYADQPLTEIREGELYFCPELRKVCVGNTEIELTAKTIHNLMSRVRHKLQVHPSGPEYIKSVRGVGYKFEPE